MARVLELTYPDNVVLVRGAMQNHRDLTKLRKPQVSVAADQVLELAAGLDRPSVLVVGPHRPEFVAALAGLAREILVVTRAIPDAAAIGTANPEVEVRCGNLADAVAGRGPYDLVVCLSDLAAVASDEDDPRTWRELAEQVRAATAPGGVLALTIENERGLHRSVARLDPYTRNGNSDWLPFATWDITRPRTTQQVRDWLGTTAASVGHLLPRWPGPTVLAFGLAESRPLRTLAATLAGRSERIGHAMSVLALQSARWADSIAEEAPAWLVLTNVDQPAGIRVGTERWQLAGDQVQDADGRPVTPGTGDTWLAQLVTAAGNQDTATMRRLLHRWRVWALEQATDDTLPAAVADLRFGNLLAGEVPVPLVRGEAPRPVEEALNDALGDFVTLLWSQGLVHPWPNSMHPETVYLALCAMAGVRPPAEPARWFVLPDKALKDPSGTTSQELAAVVKRQQEQLRNLWSRFRWDERQYLTFKAGKFTKRAAKFALRRGKALIGRGPTAEASAALDREAAARP